MAEYDYLIVGAGLFGAVFAQQAYEHGKKCLVIDRRHTIAGNIACTKIDNIFVHEYGAHIFHTDNKQVWNYINRFACFNNFVNSPLAYAKGKLYNLPFNMHTFYQLWGTKTPQEAKALIKQQCEEYSKIIPTNLKEQALKIGGRDIYTLFIKEYTEKQWVRKATDLPAFIIKRIPFRFVYNNNYFNDRYQGIPVEGYSYLVEKLLEGTEVKVNTDYFDNRVYFDKLADKIVFTGCIDQFFNYEFGKLEYRSLRFKHVSLDIEDYQGNAVVNYNDANVPYTRIIEHKHFVFGNQPSTIITKEYPEIFTSKSEPYYPVNDNKNTILYKKYREKADLQKNVIFGGRLGTYTYIDMDDIIENALKVTKKELIL
ncbi:MAG: UDP-galactopyranose mutase [Tannerellaceae bacterium]|nr:UDP-galactopyranose mutase [Tannerellaceae bacterium]